MFGIDYTFSPYKVVVSVKFVKVSSFKSKVYLTDDAISCHFTITACDRAVESSFGAAFLNSLVFPDSKRPITPTGSHQLERRRIFGHRDSMEISARLLNRAMMPFLKTNYSRQTTRYSLRMKLQMQTDSAGGGSGSPVFGYRLAYIRSAPRVRRRPRLPRRSSW